MDRCALEPLPPPLYTRILAHRQPLRSDRCGWRALTVVSSPTDREHCACAYAGVGGLDEHGVDFPRFVLRERVID